MKAFWGAFSVLPIAAVPVELLDAIGHIARALSKSAIALLATISKNDAYFEAIGMLVARPSSGVRVEEKLLFILFGYVVVQVLRNSKLPVKLREFTFVSDLIFVDCMSQVDLPARGRLHSLLGTRIHRREWQL